MKSKILTGKIIKKENYLGVLGEGIRLTIKFKDGKIKIFENAKWTLERFEMGDIIEWKDVGWFKDLRGTDNLKIIKNG